MRRQHLPYMMLLSLVLAAQTPETQRLSSPAEAARIQRVEQGMPTVVLPGGESIKLSLAEWMSVFRVPGLSVAVFDQNKILWAKVYGVREAGKKDPVTLDTRFQAGSISKPVTVMAALHFVEKGTFALDENVNDKLLSWKVPDNDLTRDQKVTLRRIMSHSAGTTVHGFQGYAVTDSMPTVVQVLNGEKPANTPPVRVDLQPGTQFRYSGGGTTILQLLMTDQLKQPFPRIMDDTIIRPLGLKHSSYEHPTHAVWASQTAAGHYFNGTVVPGRWHLYPEMAAAGLWTTASDLAEVAIEVARSKAGKSNRVLSKAMTQQMLTLQRSPMGLGFFLDSASDRFGHGGADEGFQANLMAWSDAGCGVVIMANSDNGQAIIGKLMASIAKEYGCDFKAKEEPAFLKLHLVMARKGLAQALTLAKVLKQEGTLTPQDLDTLGQRFLQAGQLPEALKLFEANVALYAEDSNAFDSLGEAQMVAGQKEAAILSYRKSLKLDPKNENAVKMLDKLGDPRE